MEVRGFDEGEQQHREDRVVRVMRKTKDSGSYRNTVCHREVSPLFLSF